MESKTKSYKRLNLGPEEAGAVLDVLVSHLCADFVQIDIDTKIATIHNMGKGTKITVKYDDVLTALLNEEIASSEGDRYLATYEFDTIYKYLKENNGLHTEVFAGKSDKGQRFVVVKAFLVTNDEGVDKYIFSYSQDITEVEALKKEKKYSEGLVANKIMTYEANLTKDLMIYSDSKWLSFAGIENTNIFSELIKAMCECIVAPEFKEYVNRTVEREYLLKAYRNGENLLTIEYKRKSNSEDYEWFEQTLNIIKDEKTDDIVLRCYTHNINERKERELRLMEEKQRYESMFAKAVSSYEVNITKNTTLKGHENWDELFGIKSTNDYTLLITALAKKTIHHDDRDKFLTVFAYQAVLENFDEDINEIICEYRRLNESGDFAWYRCTMHTFLDPNTNDVRAFSYIEDIDDEKRKELKLIYRSEHDLLTDLYNKMTAQEKIEEFFQGDELKTSKHALLMVDLDHFKDINDNLGHAFGDAVLAGVGTKMIALFRDDDIIGRIGGDEFIILMKNVSTERAVLMKAQEICDTLRETYHHGTQNYKISASVGVAIYPKHGSHYQELYKHSDTALYYSKYHGKDIYSVYSDTMGEAETSIKEIDDRLVIMGGVDEHNISQHVFRMIYESPNKNVAINSVLEFVGKHYKFSRSYVFENTPDDKYVNNTFEWCADGVTPQMDNLQRIPYGDLGDYTSNFNIDGVFYMPDVRKVDQGVQDILEPQGVKSMVQVVITKNDKFIGFVGFDFCDNYVRLEQNEILEYKTVANIMSIFITEMRVMQENEEAKNTALTIVNSLDSYAYVCDPKTHRTLFINEKSHSLAPKAQIGEYCYSAFWNKTEPCDHCPMPKMIAENLDTMTTEMYNDNLNVWVKVKTSWIDWLGEKRVCLVDSIDITEYKK